MPANSTTTLTAAQRGPVNQACSTGSAGCVGGSSGVTDTQKGPALWGADPQKPSGDALYGAMKMTVAATVSVMIAAVTATAANGVITNSR